MGERCQPVGMQYRGSGESRVQRTYVGMWLCQRHAVPGTKKGKQRLCVSEYMCCVDSY